MPLPIGESDYRTLIEYRNSEDKPYVYIDKTSFIKELCNDGFEVIVIVRPRRFGKTLNLSMLRYFFASEVMGRSTQDLFKGSNIHRWLPR